MNHKRIIIQSSYLQGKSEKFMALLKEEIEWVQELQELEPDIKCKLLLIFI